MATDGDPGVASDSGAVGEADAVTIHVRSSNGSKLSMQASLECTVGAFKVLLAEKSDVPAERQRLIYKGQILKDEKTLKSYGLESDHTIHLVHGLILQNPPADVTPAANRVSGVESGGSNGGGGFGGADFASSLFPDIGSNIRNGSGSGLLGFGLPDLSQMRQQLVQNPSMMREIMNMPAVQSLINNPDLMRNMIMNNPQMREIIDRNPEFGHILNDPSTLRQSLEAMRNPELMRELMRSTDRAMSNIESSPEGFNMLRRMYETVQEPFLNATAGAGNEGNDVDQNPFAALLGNQGGVQSRDLTPDQPGTGSNQTSESSSPNSNPLPNPWSRTGGVQTTNTTPAPPHNGRSPSIGGLSELERMAGGMPDPSFVNQLMQNPAIMQMTQSLLSDPQFMNQVLSPQLHDLLGSNSQLSSMLQNPELIQQLTSPDTLRQLLSFQQTLLSPGGQRQTSQEQNQTGATATGAINTSGLEFMMNMLSGLGSGTGAPNPGVPPEERYATQLSQLQEMGFFDTQENIRALEATDGNVHAAVDWLLRSPH
ncbi:ubiquitin domain-containing protein DSK2b-like isoform X2 [Curcuma longa]|uniref:ubiquitin domain-containing protein DSK2b-like isoform X2 n=1 Tax=Curcuma longa TaxID=136217 RepID=UPI003D9E5CD8